MRIVVDMNKFYELNDRNHTRFNGSIFLRFSPNNSLSAFRGFEKGLSVEDEETIAVAADLAEELGIDDLAANLRNGAIEGKELITHMKGFVSAVENFNGYTDLAPLGEERAFEIICWPFKSKTTQRRDALGNDYDSLSPDMEQHFDDFEEKYMDAYHEHVTEYEDDEDSEEDEPSQFTIEWDETLPTYQDRLASVKFT